MPAVAVTLVGALGAVAAVEAEGVTLLDAGDAALVPTALVARIVKLYAVPFVRPVTPNVEPAPVPLKFPGLEVTV